MSTAARLVGYATVLGLVFGAAWGAGATARDPAALGGAEGHGHPPGTPAHDHADVGLVVDGPGASGGLVASAAGYTLVPVTGALTAGAPGEYAFTLTGPDGAPGTRFDVVHERPLHLVVVRRDAAGFQHLHPDLGTDGVWRVPLTLPAGGVYRVYADFTATGGPPLVLGTDLFAAGEFTPIPHPPSRVSQVDDYQVRLDGDLLPGSSQVFATVSRGGVAVTDLEPHLGAFGHLVALRVSDLSYLHVHPDTPVPAATDRSGPGIAFTVAVPSDGVYRLFLDFRHDGVVRTAEFTVGTPTP